MCVLCGKDHPVEIDVGEALETKATIFNWSQDGEPFEEFLDLARSDVVIASSDCWHLIRHAIDEFKEEPFSAKDLVTEQALLIPNEPMIPKEWEVLDADPGTVISAFYWRPCPDDPNKPKTTFHLHIILGEAIQKTPVGRVDVALNSSHMDHFQEGQKLDESRYPGLLKFIQVYNRLANQKILTLSRTEPPRATRRRVKRYVRSEAFTNDVVHVILRRIEARKQPGESPVDWQHRWLVKSHWRNQWYPKLQSHRQCWIEEYIKGPEDKPLVIKDRVIDFKRQ